MSQVICSDYIFGTDSGILNKTSAKDVRWKTMGHWEGNSYVIDCRIVETASANHSVTYFGGGNSVSEPEAVFSSGTILYCSSIRATFAREQMAQFTATWQEIFQNSDCESASIIGLTPQFPGDCCWGLMGHATTATYGEDLDFFQIPGPTGLNGIDENNPLTGMVVIKPKTKKISINITTEKQLTSFTNISIEAAIGGCSYSIDDGKLVSIQENSQQTGFKTWTYQIEKLVEYTS